MKTLTKFLGAFLLFLLVVTTMVEAHHDGGGGKVHWDEIELDEPGDPVRESFLYVVLVDQDLDDPDGIGVIDVREDSPTYGQLLHIEFMKNNDGSPSIGDELHHFGYNFDQTKLMVPGLFSGKIRILDVSDPAKPTTVAVNEDLIAQSGYIVPHTVVGLPNGNNLVSMIGANTATTAPGGLIEIDADTGTFVRFFSGPAARNFDQVAPKYMYDLGFKVELNRMVTTAFGLPADVAPGITVSGLGNEVYVWDLKQQKVIQSVDLGPGTGALEVRWANTHGEPIGYTNVPGTGQIFAWEDLDGDGFYNFTAVVDASSIDSPFGLGIPTDMLLSSDDKFMYVADWGFDRVLQFDITDRLSPVLTGVVSVPYAQMMRLSQDNKRLYVTNSLLSTWDDDTLVPSPLTESGARNEAYGVFLIEINHDGNGKMAKPKKITDLSTDVKVVGQEANEPGTGPKRPHQVFFDPAVKTSFGHH